MTATVVATRSAIGVAQTMPSMPNIAFIMNMNGMSSPPLRSSDSIDGSSFLPTDWKHVMDSMVMDMKGAVRQMIRWKSCP